MSFLVGFLGATLVGFVATWINGLLAGIQAAIARMTSPPNPALGDIPRADVSGIGTNPDVSPIRVLSAGCSTIIVNLLLVILILAAMGAVIALVPIDVRPEQIPEEFWLGILYAGLLGFLMSTIFYNWGVIANLFNLMVNPPNPALRSAEPPNLNYVAAAPPQSPHQVVVGGCLEMILRIILQIVLVGILVFSTWEVLRFLFA